MFALWLLITLAVVVVFVLLPMGIRMLYQYERGVVFTLGKFSNVRNPGLTFLVPFIQTMRKVDMRLKTAEVPRQEVITKDNIPILVNAVVYFKVTDPEKVIIEIEDYIFAIRQYTQAALRDVIGNSDLDFVLTEREKVAGGIKEIVDSETSNWGVDVESIKIQEIELPAEMKRAMAVQAEAERNRRAVIISSQGELSASENLRQAAENLAKSSGALHLRTLQTLRDIAADPSEKIVMFMPWEIGEAVTQMVSKSKK
ncbi:MAG: slipin family protein [Candidatus Methanofastidiosa archaeon]|jgi:regulator of protease activity HflC (stomatin/prohibitin superfamily)|nr:slipin family protein [Candidatus Methanofastidiosa archaeon]